MELKVWFDGLPRIVCGVNDKTTCQDIVFALAQATGKTGRFTLIERWRNNDRLLAPSEVVMKWGEHSPDVQYILQCASIDQKTGKTPLSPSTSNTESLPQSTATTPPQDEVPSAPPPYRNPPTPVKLHARSPAKELPPYRLPPPPNPSQSNLRSQQLPIDEPPVTENPPREYKDLIQHINRQREKLTVQQAELTKHDAEIMFWETKARIQERNMETITKEITRLEILALQNDAQVVAMKEIEAENESVSVEAEKLRQETDSLRKDLARCDQELSHCKNTIRSLGDSIASAEMESLRKALSSACEEADSITAAAGSLEFEVSSIAASLGKKKAQMEELVTAMKKANLESLGMGEEETLYRSRRRIRGSARQLKDAAPTTTNPHGVWV